MQKWIFTELMPDQKPSFSVNGDYNKSWLVTPSIFSLFPLRPLRFIHKEGFLLCKGEALGQKILGLSNKLSPECFARTFRAVLGSIFESEVEFAEWKVENWNLNFFYLVRSNQLLVYYFLMVNSSLSVADSSLAVNNSEKEFD